MIRLIPMQQNDFDTFFEENIVRYAEEKVKSGNWQVEDALERSRAEFEGLLPDGLQSKDQYIFNIFDDEQESKIGILWVEVRMDEPHRLAFIFDFVIDESYRGKGFGKKSLTALDEKLKLMGVESVALHVFGYNTNAFELYKRMGYEATNINMRKNYA